MEGLLLSGRNHAKDENYLHYRSAAVLKGKKFREDSLCVIAAGVRQGEINRRKSFATNIMRIMQV